MLSSENTAEQIDSTPLSIIFLKDRLALFRKLEIEVDPTEFKPKAEWVVSPSSENDQTRNTLWKVNLKINWVNVTHDKLVDTCLHKKGSYKSFRVSHVLGTSNPYVICYLYRH